MAKKFLILFLDLRINVISVGRSFDNLREMRDNEIALVNYLYFYCYLFFRNGESCSKCFIKLNIEIGETIGL